MSILQQQSASNSGALDFVSNVNSNIVFSIDETRGAGTNRKKYIQLYEDFLGDVIGDQWSAAVGSDAQAIIATVNAGSTATGGVVRQTTGDTTVLGESCVSLTHSLNWKASNGGLYMYCRFKPITSVADVAYFVGFTNALATAALQVPITLLGTAPTAVAANAVGFVYDTNATNDAWHCQGAIATVATAALNTSIAPAVDTWVDLEIAVDTSGGATFYINGALVGTVAAAVTNSTPLTPIVAAMARTTTVKAVDVDVISVSMIRA